MLATPPRSCALVAAEWAGPTAEPVLRHGPMGRIISRMWASALDRYGASDQASVLESTSRDPGRPAAALTAVRGLAAV